MASKDLISIKKALTELVASLREDATWAEANIWEVPIMLPDHLTHAADVIEALSINLREKETADG